jgi:thioredoxin reductase
LTATERTDVAIVGGGPAGLAAAAELARAGAGRVIVIDREPQAGGIPRHAHHQGYGLRDLHRILTGPAYAARRVELAERAGAELCVRTQVTGWADGGELELTGPEGRRRLVARAVVLATGCRERPRSARLVPGTRPQGVMTTGMLQQIVYLAGEQPGRRAVVVGAEHVSFSALLTLAHGGTDAVAMTTELPHHQTFAAFRAGAALRFRIPLRTRTAVTGIQGRRRVESVELTDLSTRARETVQCDLVVFTADWIPDHELAVLAGLELDPATKGPAVDAAGRTGRPGLFATGNLLHGAETADVAALEGAHLAGGVLAYLDGAPWPAAGVRLRCEPPLRWVAPSVVATPGAAPARGRHLLRSHEDIRDVRVELVQDGRRLAVARLPRVMPGRSARLPEEFTAGIDPDGGPAVIRAAAGRRPWGKSAASGLV